MASPLRTFRAGQRTRLDDRFWNRFIDTLVAELDGLKSTQADYQGAVRQLVETGLSRIDDALAPAYAEIEAAAQLGALLSARSDSTLTPALGQVEMVIVADQRRRFAPAGYVSVAAETGTSAMAGWLVAYDPGTGVLTLDVDLVRGATPASAWRVAIAQAPALEQRVRWRITAAGGETALSGVDATATELVYVVGSESVHLNGVRLVRGLDYQATTGTTITGLAPLAAGDVAEVDASKLADGDAQLANALLATLADYATLHSPQLTGTPTAPTPDVGSEDQRIATTAFVVAALDALVNAAPGSLYYNVKALGATGDGVTDDTSAMQDALDACAAAGGGIVFIPAGTYIISQSLIVASDTTIRGVGAATVIQAGQTSFVGTNPAKTCFLLRNAHYSASSLTDSDITIESLTLDYGSVVVSGGGAHCIAMRYVDRVTVRDVWGRFGENVTALLACRDTLVENCHGYNQRNCFFDHWDGAGTARVIACTGRSPDVNINQGIMFTGTGSFGEDRTSIDCLVMGCSLYRVRAASGFGSAIISNAADADSFSYRFRSIGNIVDDCDFGLVFDGEGGQHCSIGDTIKQCSRAAVHFANSFSDTSDGCLVDDLTMVDCSDLSGEPGIVSIDGSNNHVRNIRTINTTAVAYRRLVWVRPTAVDCSVHILDADDGTVARVGDQGTRTRVIDEIRARETLTANRTYYVRTDGNDANTGLADNAGGAFRTIQKAVDVAAALDSSIYSVTILVRAGTYTAPVVLKGLLGPGTLTIQGDTATPANVVISTTSAHCFLAKNVRNVTLAGFKTQSTTAGNHVLAEDGAAVTLGAWEFGAMPAGASHVLSQRGAQVALSAAYAISGGGQSHLQAAYNGRIISTATFTVTLTGTPNFAGAFAWSQNASFVLFWFNTFSGAATGPRYVVSQNSVINTGGGGATYFPGSAAGAAASGGQYV